MPQFRLTRKDASHEIQQVSLQIWLEAASSAQEHEWFEGVGDLDSPQKVETLQTVAKVILGATFNNTGVNGDSRFIDFARKLDDLLDNWRILWELSGPTNMVFRNDKGVCFEANLVLGDTVQFQAKVSEEQRMAVRSDFKFPKMQANLTKSVDSIYAGLRMGFLRDMDLLTTLISMWEKKAVKTR